MPQPNHLLRAIRERTPSRRMPGRHMSRDELAEAVVSWLAKHDDKGHQVAFDGNHLGKIERGVVGRPRTHYVAALCAILGATEAALGFAATVPELAGQPLDIEVWELTDVLTRSTVDLTALGQMEEVALDYAAQYPSTPPKVLLASVSRLLVRTKEILSQPQPLQARRRCELLLGVLCGLAGNLWFDLGRKARAAGFFDVGELASQQADDSDLTAWLLATRSIVPYYSGLYAETAQLLTRAEEVAGRRSSPRRRAWIAALRARVEAANGDRDQSLAALDRAGDHLGNVREAPGGTDFFDAARFDGLAGSTYLLLSNTGCAVRLLSQALAKRDAVDAKGRALITLDLAHCHAVAREPEEAVRLAHVALDAARGTLVDPVVSRAKATRAGLDEWGDLRAVRELDVRLMELARG